MYLVAQVFSDCGITDANSVAELVKLFSTEHGSWKDAEAGAPKAHAEEKLHIFTQIRLTVPKKSVPSGEPAVQLPCECLICIETSQLLSAPTETSMTSYSDDLQVPQTSYPKRQLPWSRPLLSPSHQKLYNTIAPIDAPKSHPQQHHQKPQTAPLHFFQWS